MLKIKSQNQSHNTPHTLMIKTHIPHATFLYNQMHQIMIFLTKRLCFIMFKILIYFTKLVSYENKS